MGALLEVMRHFDPIAKPGTQVRVWGSPDGYFVFVAMRGGKQVGQGGADREIPDVDTLIARTSTWIDWSRNVELSMELRMHELAHIA
jgi:hypothetical protein